MSYFPEHLLQLDEMTQRYFRLISAWKVMDRRTELGISQTDLGREMGVKRSTLALWEQHGFPTYVTAQQVSAMEAYLNVEPGWLYRDDSPADMTLEMYVLVVMTNRREKIAHTASFLLSIPKAMRASAAARAKERRQHLNLSRDAVERQLEVGNGTLQYWEFHHLPASIDKRVVERWEKALNVQPGWLLSDLPMPQDASGRRMFSRGEVDPKSFSDGVRLAQLIRARRRDLRMAAATLTKRIDLHETSLALWESGISIPEVDESFIQAIEVALRLPGGSITGGDAISAPPIEERDALVALITSRIRQRRKQLNVSQPTLSRCLDLPVYRIEQWDLGQGFDGADRKLIARIEKALSLPGGWLKSGMPLPELSPVTQLPDGRVLTSASKQVSIGSRIAARRGQLGLTRLLVSEKIGVSENCLRKWELGAFPQRYKGELTARVENALSVPVGWLVSDAPLPLEVVVHDRIDIAAASFDEKGMLAGWRMRVRRVELGISLLRFCSLIGLGETAVANWELRSGIPSRCPQSVIDRIELVLNVRSGWLHSDDATPQTLPVLMPPDINFVDLSADVRISLGPRIAARRKQIGLDHNSVAESVGRSPPTVYNWEKNPRLFPRRMKVSTIRKLENVLQVPEGWLLSGSASSDSKNGEP